MIKSSLRSAGMTECLINFKNVVFGQPNQMDGKYCLSWQAGQSINFVLFVLVVASAGSTRSKHNFGSPVQALDFIVTLLAVSSPLVHRGETQGQIFSFAIVALFYLRIS